jgi:hypothetical protein
MIKIYERLKRIERPSAEDMAQEITSSSSEEGASISLTFSDDSFKDDVPESLDVKEYSDVNMQGKLIVTPLFKSAQKLKQWTRVLDHHEARIESLG